MTVNELIEKLQECDKPDAPVRLGAEWIDADGVKHVAASVLATEVFYDETQGPIYIYGPGASATE